MVDRALTRVLFGLILLTSGLSASAAPAVDDKPLIDFMDNFVYTLTQPVYVWKWFRGDEAKGLTDKISPDNALGFAKLQKATAEYWPSYVVKKESNSGYASYDSEKPFGPALYAAIDPVATSGPDLQLSSSYSYNYSGDTKKTDPSAPWALMQIQMPVGLRFVDLNRDGGDSLPLHIQEILAAYNCPTAWNDVADGLTNLLSANAMSISYYRYSSSGQSKSMTSECIAEMRKILKDTLNIQAIFFQGDSVEFKECRLHKRDGSEYPDDNYNLPPTGGNNPNRHGRFLILDSTPFAAKDVRLYNAQTTEDKDQRLRLQSFFYKADFDAKSIYYKSYLDGVVKEKYPNYKLQYASRSCQSDYSTSPATTKCALQLNMYSDSNGSMQGTAPLPPVPTEVKVISHDQLPQSQRNNFKDLLWSDLDGQAVDSQLGDWIVKNLFGCPAEVEYDSAY